MTEIERLEKKYKKAEVKFVAAMDAADAAYVAASVVYDAANDIAEAVRDAATRATEEEFTIAVLEVRAAALALYKARKEQAADEIDALEAEQEKEPICIYDQLNNTICKGAFINGYGCPCSTCVHASHCHDHNTKADKGATHD